MKREEHSPMERVRNEGRENKGVMGFQAVLNK